VQKVGCLGWGRDPPDVSFIVDIAKATETETEPETATWPK